MKKVIVGTVLLLVASVAFVTLGGMAWLDSIGVRGEERAVEYHMHKYWKARVTEDFETLGRYVHPEQGGITLPGMLVTEGYRINEVVVEGDRARAMVTVDSRLKHARMAKLQRRVDLVDTWEKVDGRWVRQVQARGLSDMIKRRKTAADREAGLSAPTIQEPETSLIP